MIRKVLLPFIIVFICSVVSFAQEPQEDLSLLSNGKLKKLGTKAMYSANYYSAIRYFEELCRHKEDAKIMFLLAENYRIVRNYPFAQYWYDRAYKMDPERNAKALYYYARMLQISQQYEEAGQQFAAFRKAYKDYPDSKEFGRLAKNHMEGCDSAAEFIKNPVKVRVNLLNSTINTVDNEFSPLFLTPTTMLYASLSFDTLDIDPKLDSIEAPSYFAGSKSTRSWQGMGEYSLQEQDNPLEFAQNGAFSPDFQRFYFVKCEKESGLFKKGIETCKLYVSKKVYGIWQPAEPMPEHVNVKNASIFSVTVGNESRRNDEVVYFVTDKLGGRGGLDIWYTIYDSKKEIWTEPKNGGGRINSPGDEMTPHFDVSSRTLYYSSNGFPGFGGYDIYYSIGELGKWTPAENIGYPINSSYDDYYFSISDDGKQGLLSSNRPGSASSAHPSCCDDLYAVDFENIIEIPITGRVFEIEDKELQKLLSEGFSSGAIEPKQDSIDVHFIAGSTVSLFVGNTNEKVFIATTETDENGNYFFNVAADRDYVLQFEHVRTGSAMIPFTTKGITEPDTIKIEDYGINYITKDPLIIKNIYYDYGKYKLTPQHREIIDNAILKLLKEAPEIIVEISSHTDNHGSADFNQKLSQRRADEIINYLVKNGIEKTRLEGKGYGFEKPIAPNTYPDGTDNPDGRQLNRRTEFRVVGSVEQLIDYTTDESEEIEE